MLVSQTSRYLTIFLLGILLLEENIDSTYVFVSELPYGNILFFLGTEEISPKGDLS